MARGLNEFKLETEDENFIRSTWHNLLKLYEKREDKLRHWLDNEQEYGAFKDVEALLGFTEPFLFSRTSFYCPEIDPRYFFECLSNIYDYIDNTRKQNSDKNDQFMGFDSEPYPRIKRLYVDYIDGAANVLLLSLDTLEISEFLVNSRSPDKNWILPDELKNKMKKAVDSAFKVLMDSVIDDEAGARWTAISGKVGSKVKVNLKDLDAYSNLVSTYYSYRALKKLTEIPFYLIGNEFGVGANSITPIKNVLSRVIFWVNSLYDRNLESYWLSNSRDSSPLISSLYALEIIYSYNGENLDNYEEVLNNAKKVVIKLLQRFQNLDQASSKFQLDVAYPYPRIEDGKVKGTESYDERRYIGAYLGIFALAKEKDPTIIESEAKMFVKATTELSAALRDEWIDKSLLIWDDGRPLVYYASDAMFGLLLYYSTGQIMKFSIREDILRIKIKEYLTSTKFVDEFVEKLMKSKELESIGADK